MVKLAQGLQKGEVQDTVGPEFNLILQPEFPLNALVLASEALRIANQNSGRELFRWRFVSEDGLPVRASNGMWMSVDDSLQTMAPADFYLVFEGNLPVQRNSPKLLNQLRTVARFGASIGAVDTGAFALAQAGLVDSRRGGPALGGGPDVQGALSGGGRPRPDLHDRRPADHLCRRHCDAGHDARPDRAAEVGTLANEVANALVYAPRRPRHRNVRMTGRSPAKPTLSDRIVALMERNLDFPLSLLEHR